MIIKDEILADILYTIVHDLSETIIKGANAEIKHKLYPRYLTQINIIKEWAHKKGFYILEEKAENCLEKIGDK